jgi:hypothetical protein
MEEERIAELALKCFDGNPEKALALLELLRISIQPECSMPDVEMQLPEETCCYEREGDCWKDIPDSIRACRKPCLFFKSSVE